MSKRRRQYMQEFPEYDEQEREYHLVLAIRWLIELIKRDSRRKGRRGRSVRRIPPRPKTLK